jgi:hypothetical protein
MKETDSKKLKDEEFTRQHTITEQEFKKLIAEKMERAKFYSFSFKERESRAKLAD